MDLDFAEEHKNLGCRKLTEVFGIGKVAASNILKSKQKLCDQYEQFHENIKRDVAQETTKLLMSFCTYGTKNAAPLVCIQQSYAERRGN